MMNKGIITVLTILLFTLTLHADENRRTLYVEGSQEITVNPDLCIMVIGVQTKANELAEAYDDNNRVMGKINEIVKSEGIDPKDLKTSQFSVSKQTRYDNKKSEYVFDGYNVLQELVIKIRDFTKIVPIMNGAIESGATQIREISFTLENPGERERELREITIKAVLEKAEHIAQLMKVRLVKPISINTSSAPIVQSSRGEIIQTAGVRDAPEVQTQPIIQPGEMKLAYTVRVTYEIK